MTSAVTPPPSARSGSAAAPAAPGGTLTQLPPGLSSLGAGSTVAGEVVSTDTAGQILIRTASGNAVLSTATTLPPGSTVTLQVQASGGQQLQVAILAVNRPPAGAAAAVANPAAPAAGAATLLATVLSPPTGAAPLPGSPPIPPPGAAPQLLPGLSANAAPTAAQAIVTRLAAGPAPTPARPPGNQTAATQFAPNPNPAAGATPAPPTEAKTTAPQTPDPGAKPQPGLASPSNTPMAQAAARPPVLVSGQPQTTTTVATTVSANPPAPGAPFPTAAPLPSAPPMTAPAATPAGTPAAGFPFPAAGTTIAVRLLASAAPGEPPPRGGAAQSTRDMPTLTATVAGRTSTGQTVVDTPLGRLALPLPSALPAGSALLLELPEPMAPPPPLTQGALPGGGAAGLPQALAAATEHWPDIRAVLEALARTDPGLARNTAQAGIPRPGASLLAQALAFFAALQTGDARQWLGAAATKALLESGDGETLARLDRDFNELGRLAAPQGPGEWRALFVPLNEQGALSQLRIFSRRQKRPGKRGKDDETRFVVEVDLSRLGELQLDGLYQKKRLAMILRSHEELPFLLREELSEVFAGGCAAAEIAGSIQFQVARDFPVSPLKDMAQQPAGVVV